MNEQLGGGFGTGLVDQPNSSERAGGSLGPIRWGLSNTFLKIR